MPRILVVGGHTRNIGKTQLVVEIIRAFPRRAGPRPRLRNTATESAR